HASQVTMATAADTPARALMELSVTTTTDAAPVPLVSTATSAKKFALQVVMVCPVLGSVRVKTRVHVTRRQEAATARPTERFQCWGRGRQKEAYRHEPYLTEQTWLIITLTLASLLLIRLLAHFLRATRRWLLFGFSYTQVPLSDVKGEALTDSLLQLH
ncbi:hypothetical protein KUCAC02_035806, partial [Chaenocephalus aceratus]